MVVTKSITFIILYYFDEFNSLEEVEAASSSRVLNALFKKTYEHSLEQVASLETLQTSLEALVA
jgi:hypothetical protein